MEIISSYLDTLKVKIEAIVNQNKKLDSRIKLLENEISELSKIIQEQKEDLKINDNKYTALMCSKSFESENPNDVKKTINEMVREIDKCIAYLNK